MRFGMGNWLRAVSINRGRSAEVASPALGLRYSNQAPCSFSRCSSLSTSTPTLRANPSAARVGAPSVSNAALRFGPRRSSKPSGWRTARSVTRTARRRGEANHSSWVWLSCALSSARFNCSAKAEPKPCKALGGSSSVPTSTNKSATSLPVVTGIPRAVVGPGPRAVPAESRPPGGCRSRFVPPFGPCPAPAGCSPGARSPKWRGAHPTN